MVIVQVGKKWAAYSSGSPEKIEAVAVAISELPECHESWSHVLYAEEAVVGELIDREQLESYQFACVVAHSKEQQSEHGEPKGDVVEYVDDVVV